MTLFELKFSLIDPLALRTGASAALLGWEHDGGLTKFQATARAASSGVGVVSLAAVDGRAQRGGGRRPRLRRRLRRRRRSVCASQGVAIPPVAIRPKPRASRRRGPDDDTRNSQCKKCHA